ncbi:unnamed protein product [Polarella glacialis]|uniref:PPPDE domain-containing protein n=1 Tax=Polarella glacialis TaxID=89957 RepID=A0A813K8W1_POLGL|nr:unnamed protein product [Polarella glacialis]
MGNSLLLPSGHETQATNKVELAASEIFGVPGIARIYHTSVLVNGEEYYFSNGGIFCDRLLSSHRQAPHERRCLGWSNRAGPQLLNALSSHFRPGSYDLLGKNCNTFSDCALYYLLRIRLERRYSAMDRVGKEGMGVLNYVWSTISNSEETDTNYADEILDALARHYSTDGPLSWILHQD